MRVVEWLCGLWYARLRAIDRAILWPCCRDNGGDLDLARAAFALHAFKDDAWLVLGSDEIKRQIDDLH